MKKQILWVVCLLFAGTVYAQDLPQQDVPSVVVNVFNQRFPKAVDVEWEKKGDLYNVEFEIGRRDHEAWIDGKGNMVRHKQEISSRELPKAVTSSIKKMFTAYRLSDVDKIQEGDKTRYKVEVKTLTAEQDLWFDDKGNPLK